MNIEEINRWLPKHGPYDDQPLYVTAAWRTSDHEGEALVGLQFRVADGPLAETCPNEACPGLPVEIEEGEEGTAQRARTPLDRYQSQLDEVLVRMRDGAPTAGNDLRALVQLAAERAAEERSKPPVFEYLKPAPLQIGANGFPQCPTCNTAVMPGRPMLAFVRPSLVGKRSALVRVLLECAALHQRADQVRTEEADVLNKTVPIS